jgi:hypothetical protein
VTSGMSAVMAAAVVTGRPLWTTDQIDRVELDRPPVSR